MFRLVKRNLLRFEVDRFTLSAARAEAEVSDVWPPALQKMLEQPAADSAFTDGAADVQWEDLT